jgi:hypothetical protein
VNGKNISVADFIKFYEDKEGIDVNSQYLFSMCSVYGQAIINFRMAVRRNNSSLLWSAKYVGSGIFFVGNHPFYRKITVYDLQQYLMMPAPVKRLIDENSSFTVSGHPSKGQGLDYLLEEKNREIKQYIPKNVTPSEDMWLTLCRNNESLKKVQATTCKLFQCTESEGTFDLQKNVHCPNAVHVYRKNMRKLKYMYPEHGGEHSSLSVKSVKLHNELVNFCTLSERNRQLFIKKEVLGSSTERLEAVKILAE